MKPPNIMNPPPPALIVKPANWQTKGTGIETPEGVLAIELKWYPDRTKINLDNYIGYAIATISENCFQETSLTPNELASQYFGSAFDLLWAKKNKVARP